VKPGQRAKIVNIIRPPCVLPGETSTIREASAANSVGRKLVALSAHDSCTEGKTPFREPTETSGFHGELTDEPNWHRQFGTPFALGKIEYLGTTGMTLGLANERRRIDRPHLVGSTVIYRHLSTGDQP
jgi:hypothetical protein